MTDNCFKKNTLAGNGTTQQQRFTAALAPAYFQPDERSIEDLLLFVANYAGLLNYYPADNALQANYTDGDWKPFIQSDAVYQLAGILRTRSTAPSTTFNQYIRRYETADTQLLRIATYTVLWDIASSLAKDINDFYIHLNTLSPLKQDIRQLIANQSGKDLKNLVAWFYHGIHTPTPHIFDPNAQAPYGDDDYNFQFTATALTTFDPAWIVQDATSLNWNTWNNYLTALKSKTLAALNKSEDGFYPNFFGEDNLTTNFDKIDYSVRNLKNLFTRLHESYIAIIGKAQNYLNTALNTSADHAAHHALILSFLKLFNIQQQELNTYTQKHLEFYYQKILNIQPAKAVSDKVHLVFEPARNVNPSHKIDKGTLLKGKDTNGKELQYATDQELIINQATVASLQTVFLPAASSTIQAVYASPVANSKDGLGTAFDTDDHSWQAFGAPLTYPKATIGFLLASPALLLNEGARTITVRFNSAQAGTLALADFNDFKKYFSIAFTTPKGWSTLSYDSTNPLYPSNASFTKTANYFELTFTLQEQFPAVITFDPTLHDGGYTLQHAAARFTILQDLPGGYDKLKNIQLTTINITVTVKNLKNLLLQNDLGVMDPTKPFLPFGSTPQKGSTFYLGNEEIFSKNLKELKFKIDWLGLPADLVANYTYNTGLDASNNQLNTKYLDIDSPCDFKANLSFLTNRKWDSQGETSLFSKVTSDPDTDNYTGYLIEMKDGTLVQKGSCAVTPGGSSSGTFNFFDNWYGGYLGNQLGYKLQIQAATNAAGGGYSADTEKGFAKFELTSPTNAFGHNQWNTAYAQQAITLASVSSNKDKYSLPGTPYTPTIKSLLIDYTASHTISLGASYAPDKGQFLQLFPFGYREAVNNSALSWEYLVPSFTFQDKQATTQPLLAAVYIGLQNMAPSRGLSILLQLNEGSEDMSLNIPSAQFDYLTADGWKALDKNITGNTTSQLTTSGIFSFILPIDAVNNNKQMAGNLYWLRIAVATNERALPNWLEVLPQAVTATFVNQGNAVPHLATALPADTITKLVNADAAVKTIQQPYPSFGGQLPESGNIFYNRVSERLRHKQRAITIWDHERLTLQQFPSLHKIKCLNHTGYKTPATKTGYSETLPGAVMLIAVPDTRNQKGGNIYQPKLSADTLENIRVFIQGNPNLICSTVIPALDCGFATLTVENPLYETIKVTCQVQYTACTTDKEFYRQQLNADLKTFLAPWTSDATTTINFGGALHQSVILKFMEDLPYIDYLVNLSIEHRDALTSTLLNITEPTEAVTTTSRSVLTTADDHNITNL